MRTYKLYGAGAGTGTNNLANVTVQKNGRIRNLRWNCQADLDADLETATWELSTASSAQVTTNDTPNVIDQVSVNSQFTTSGMTQGAINVSRENMDFPVAAGEKLYLNTVITGSPSERGTVFIDVEEL